MPLRGAQAALPAAQVELLELVGGGGLELRQLQVDAAHVVAARDQGLRQVVPDEAAGAGDEDARAGRHAASLRARASSRAK